MNKIEELIGYGRENGCSDIHLTFGSEPVLRRHGKLMFLKGYGIMDDATLLECADLVLHSAGNKMGMGEPLEDLDICYETEDGGRNRVNIYHQQNHVALAIRLLKEHIPTLEELSAPPRLKEITQFKEGLVLISGPAGSGKSTILAACVNEINTSQNKHIITVENPIEYYHKNIKCIVNQREVGTDVGNFAQAVKSALREDADVIVVGELNNPETILAVLTAAEAGHLVFSTLHILGAEKSIAYMVDLFPPYQQQQIRTRLSAMLKAVLSQQLVAEEGQSERRAVREIWEPSLQMPKDENSNKAVP